MNNEKNLMEDFVVEILINNKVEEDILNRFKVDLIGFLRDRLNNNQIKIITKFIKKSNKKKLYTNTDKFEYLAKKNPSLNDLKTRLGLDPEF